jgi:hypothetical protein
VARSCLVVLKACLGVHKMACRVLMAKVDQSRIASACVPIETLAQVCHTHSPTHAPPGSRARTPTQTHTRKHTRKHTHIHTHTHYTHTHTHTHDAQASMKFTRAAEDLAALSVLDQSECKEVGTLAVAALREAAEAVKLLSAHRQGVDEHVAGIDVLVHDADAAVSALP